MADAAPTDGAQPESCPAATAGIALASAEPAGGRGMSGPEESRDTPPAAAAGAGGQSSQESDLRAEAAANAAASAATPPEADADDADDDDDDGYVAPPAADISEVRDAGKGHPEDDESMKRYKEALLGPDASSGPGAPLVVEILELRLEHGAGPGAASEDAGPTLSVALGGSAAEAAAAAPLTVKGGGWRRVSIRFRVRGQIVHGLKLKMRIRGATSGIQCESGRRFAHALAPLVCRLGALQQAPRRLRVCCSSYHGACQQTCHRCPQWSEQPSCLGHTHRRRPSKSTRRRRRSTQATFLQGEHTLLIAR